MTNWKDIFNHKVDLTDKERLSYLNKDVSEEELYAIEQQLANDAFEQDALEGLAAFPPKTNLQSLTQTLNQQLKKQIDRESQRRVDFKKHNQLWIIVAVMAVLFLSVFGYLLIHFSR